MVISHRHAFVSTKLDYCNSLFYGLPDKDLRKLQAVQNAAARLVGGLRRYDHVTPVMHDLHWLPVEYRIQFKIAVLAYKSLHNLAPEYLSAMCQPVSMSEALRRNRSAVNGDLTLPSWNTVSYGQRGFTYAAAKIWNNLPLNIRQLQSLLTFRKHLKTFLFRKAYYGQ